MTRTADPDLERTLEEAFDAETRRGVQLAIIGRTIAFALLGLSFYIDADQNLRNPQLHYRLALVAVALVSGLANLLIARKSARPVRWSYPFVVLDLVLVAALPFGWVPPFIADYPQFVAVRMQDVLLYTVVISLTVLPLQRALVLFAGGAASLIWGAAVVRSFLKTPGAITDNQALRGVHGWTETLTAISKPLVLNTDYLMLQMVLLVVFAALLSMAVGHGRALVEFAVRAEQDMDLLGRFFPPAVARRLAGDGGALRLTSETRPVAVLFTDFNHQAPGAGGLAQLGGFYAACERVVFEHGGVIDRYAGDPVMATFGALDSDGPPPAEQAWACARALEAAQAARPFGLAGVGVNLGDAVCGEVGSERQRAFGVVGEVVNTARRMLDVANDRGGAIVLTDAVARALPAEARSGLTSLGAMSVKGLSAPVTVWAGPA